MKTAFFFLPDHVEGNYTLTSGRRASLAFLPGLVHGHGLGDAEYDSFLFPAALFANAARGVDHGVLADTVCASLESILWVESSNSGTFLVLTIEAK